MSRQTSTHKTYVPDKWDASKIPSLKNKVAIVTGANSGIGYVTARELARNGAHVVLACRSERRGREAEAKLTSELAASAGASRACGACGVSRACGACGESGTPGASGATVGNVGSVTFAKLDVSSLESVKCFVDDFKRTHNRLDLLVNNAGIFAVPFALTVDGIESQFATNHLGHFALTAQLFDLLKTSTPSRVVNVSSMVHREAKFDEDVIVNVQDKYDAYTAYADSKLSNILFTKELDRRIKDAGINGVTVATCDPGATWTNLLTAPATENGFVAGLKWRFWARLSPWFFQSASMGALPSLFAATAPNVQGGDYFSPGGFLKLTGYPILDEPSNASESKSAATTLWSLSEQLANLSFVVRK